LLLQLLGIPNDPWEEISYDFIIKLPKSKGNDSILVAVDRSPRWHTSSLAKKPPQQKM
jgi:hypothetical protein